MNSMVTESRINELSNLFNTRNIKAYFVDDYIWSLFFKTSNITLLIETQNKEFDNLKNEFQIVYSNLKDYYSKRTIGLVYNINEKKKISLFNNILIDYTTHKNGFECINKLLKVYIIKYIKSNKYISDIKKLINCSLKIDYNVFNSDIDRYLSIHKNEFNKVMTLLELIYEQYINVDLINEAIKTGIVNEELIKENINSNLIKELKKLYLNYKDTLTLVSNYIKEIYTSNGFDLIHKLLHFNTKEKLFIQEFLRIYFDKLLLNIIYPEILNEEQIIIKIQLNEQDYSEYTGLELIKLNYKYNLSIQYKDIKKSNDIIMSLPKHNLDFLEELSKDIKMYDKKGILLLVENGIIQTIFIKYYDVSITVDKVHEYFNKLETLLKKITLKYDYSILIQFSLFEQLISFGISDKLLDLLKLDKTINNNLEYIFSNNVVDFNELITKDCLVETLIVLNIINGSTWIFDFCNSVF